jgi:hypothetical protein
MRCKGNERAARTYRQEEDLPLQVLVDELEGTVYQA